MPDLDRLIHPNSPSASNIEPHRRILGEFVFPDSPGDDSSPSGQCQDQGAKTAGSHCAQCGANRTTPFCPCCGQENREVAVPLRELLQEAYDEFIKFDRRVIVTLRLLITRPGLLANEYLQGRGRHYLSPARLYFYGAAILLSILNVTGNLKSLEALGSDPDPSYVAMMSRTVEIYVSSLPLWLTLIVPLQAFCLNLLFWGKRRFYVEHLVLSAHLNLIWMLAATLAFIPGIGGWTLLASIPLAGVHQMNALRFFYSEGLLWSAVKNFALLITLTLLTALMLASGYVIAVIMSAFQIMAVIFVGGFVLSLIYVIIKPQAKTGGQSKKNLEANSL